MTNANAIFVPVLVQIWITIVLYGILAKRKRIAVRHGDVDESRRALHADAWPDYVVQINNAIRNQFEVPILFYVLTLMIYALNLVNAITLSLAGLFILTRLVHVYIHTTSNYVPLRRNVFLSGCLVLLVMSIYAAVGVVDLF